MTKGAGGPADGILQALAKKYAVNPGEVSLRWCVDQDVVAITTSGKEQRLSDYLRAMTFKLTPKEIKEVRTDDLALAFVADESISSMRRASKSICVASGITSMVTTTSGEILYFNGDFDRGFWKPAAKHLLW